MEQAEEWRDVVGYEGRYQVSNMGRIRSFTQHHGRPRGYVLKQYLKDNGYLQVALYKELKAHHIGVHVLVMEHFVGPRPSAHHDVNHKDRHKQNNQLSNLEWLTKSENIMHGGRHIGEENGSAKLTEEIVAEIRRRHVPGQRGYARDLIREYGISKSSFYRIVKRTLWKHVA